MFNTELKQRVDDLEFQLNDKLDAAYSRQLALKSAVELFKTAIPVMIENAGPGAGVEIKGEHVINLAKELEKYLIGVKE